MSVPLLLGLDLGTTNAKAAAYDLQGHQVAAAAVAYETRYPQPGWAEQRSADWCRALASACRQLMANLAERKHDLVAIGLSAHGPGVIFLDKDGQSLLEYSPTWQDTRCLPHGERLLATVGSAWTGLGIPRNSFPAKLCSLVEQFPGETGQARVALGIKEYLTYWLTGEIATEPTNVAGGLTWSSALFAACDWSLDRLAPIVASTAVVGLLRSTLVEELGLPRPLPVIPGLADGAAATLSMGAIAPQQAVLTLATSGVIRLVLEEPVASMVHLDHDLFCWPYLAGRWIVGGHIKAAASALQWLGEIQSVEEIEKLLADAATSPPGSCGVIFLPYLLGRGTPHADENARAAFLGLSLAHQRADLTRAVLEGVAFAYREVLEDFGQLGYRIDQLRISGGGARSPLWRQIVADVLDRPLVYYTADSALGAAMAAAIGMGYFVDFQAAVVAMVRAESVINPQSNEVAHYDEAWKTYRMMRDRLYPTHTVPK